MSGNLNLGVIGNCSYAALVDAKARVNWACLPRLDGDPAFCSLLSGEDDPKAGFMDVDLAGFARSEQRYIHNTAILVTTLFDWDGGAVEITDFAPRFRRLDRMFRPIALVRHVRPVSGHPRITVRVRPVHSYNRDAPDRTRGSNHIRYVLPHLTLRLTTDAPVSYVMNETPFILEEPFTLLLGPDESLNTPIHDTARQYFDSTLKYWHEWSRSLAIPFDWQKAVIRAAITLKLCSFEESGAIVAALTTSIPEAAGTERNWDYRFCWLRDAYFVVQALNRLGVTRTMEDHLRYITNIVADISNGVDEHLQPVYGIGLESRLVEKIETALPGYRGMGPVRNGNQAYEHIQNDVYGSVILAAAQSFFDQRLARRGDQALFTRLEAVGKRCLELFDKPDAGLWEFRTIAKVHTHSAVICWAGVDRLARIAERIGLSARAEFWRKSADVMHDKIVDRAYDAERNTFVESFDGDDVDASLLLLLEAGFVKASDPRFVGTVEAVEKRLRRGDFLYRYAAEDDFGTPETAFNICTFWYIDALAAIGRTDEARKLFDNMLKSRNHLGLLSEDIDPETGELWGNFPQTYSMVGLINSAMRLSRKWRDAF